MVETPQDELSLRDIVEVLRRHRVYLWAFPLILAALALIYGFLIAEPTYASTATISVGPLDQQGQAPTLSFEGVRDIALSQAVLSQVWEALNKEGKLPPRWQAVGVAQGISRLEKDLSLKDAGSRQANVPYLLVRLSVKAPDPEVAARAANLWVEATKREVDNFFRKYWAGIEEKVQAELAVAKVQYREVLARRKAFLAKTTLFRDKAELDFLQGIQFSSFPSQQGIQFSSFPSQQVVFLNTERPYGERLRLLREIAEVEDLLATAQEDKRRALEERRELLKLQLQKIEDRIKDLQDRVAQAENELAFQDESLSRAREAYQAVAQRIKEIRLARSQGEWASILAPAHPIYEKVAPKRGLLLALAVALGLMLGVMAAFVAEALRPKEPAPQVG
jgi:uncharacterized protein involved in exopolysaccharide biosynthesis